MGNQRTGHYESRRVIDYIPAIDVATTLNPLLVRGVRGGRFSHTVLGSAQIPVNCHPDAVRPLFEQSRGRLIAMMRDHSGAIEAEGGMSEAALALRSGRTMGS